MGATSGYVDPYSSFKPKKHLPPKKNYHIPTSKRFGGGGGGGGSSLAGIGPSSLHADMHGKYLCR
jgi:hypothetical protein